MKQLILGLYDIRLTDRAGNEAIVQAGTNCILIEDSSGNKIPVPLGFSPITTEDQGTKYTGFVIKNNTDNNEYVWVPVDSTTSYTYDRYAFSKEGWTYSQTKGEYDSITNSYKIIKQDQSSYYYTEAIPNIGNRTELESVTQFGGYYIGRYEVGITGYTSLSTTSDGTTTWTGYSNGTAVVQKGQQVWNYIAIDKAREIAEGMYRNNDAITSRLCSSYAWNTALKFIETNDSNYATNSTQGNYEDTTFEYTDLNGNTKTKATNEKMVVPTGQTIAVNNIYDMGGNVWEWTTELYSYSSTSYTVCGGSFLGDKSNYPAAYRYGSDSIVPDENIGFRVVLFL